MLHRLIIPVVLALVLAGCTGEPGSTPVSTGTSPGGEVIVGDTAPPGTPAPPPTCQETAPIRPGPTADPYVEFVSSGDPGLASVTISQATFECAVEVVVVDATDIDRIAVGAVLAAGIDAPLLIGSRGTSALVQFELERLAPERVIALGDEVTVFPPEWTEVERLSGDTTAGATAVNARLGTSSTLPLPGEPGVATIVATANALQAAAGLLPPAPTTTTTITSTTVAASSTSTTVTTTTVPEPIPQPEPEEVPGLTIGAGTSGVAVLVDGNDTAAALAAIAAADASGAIASLVDERDLRRVAEAGQALQSSASPVGAIHVLGDVTGSARWELEVIRNAEQLPGGGFLVLPRLMVALYGNPLTAALGALGEQGPADAVTRTRTLAAGYADSEAPVLPTFEIIATVAAADVGSDADYSNEMGPEVIQPWIDVAAAEGVYVILDLQPGRDSFVNQAKEYEEYLLNPHVGLALDPEWRLTPDQFHLEQIGRVDAAEVNEVISWMAELVRENQLPQKVLLLHQFRLFMIQDRETLNTPPELQVIIQMDGQGAVPDKYATWNTVTAGWEEHPWRWGWKNFYDEDSPGPIPPSDIFDLVPEVVYVSYQ